MTWLMWLAKKTGLHVTSPMMLLPSDITDDITTGLTDVVSDIISIWCLSCPDELLLNFTSYSPTGVKYFVLFYHISMSVRKPLPGIVISRIELVLEIASIHLTRWQSCNLRKTGFSCKCKWCIWFVMQTSCISSAFDAKLERRCRQL